MTKQWELIGHVAVDSGQLMIHDPCYRKQLEIEKTMAGDIVVDIGAAKSLNFDKGHEGAGVLFSSGIGDGVYPVYAKFKTLPDWGTRIAEIKIVMI